MRALQRANRSNIGDIATICNAIARGFGSRDRRHELISASLSIEREFSEGRTFFHRSLRRFFFGSYWISIIDHPEQITG